jgi:hypothetical protein
MFQVTGHMTSAVALSLVEADLPWGKWVQPPNPSLGGGPDVVAFVAVAGEGGSDTGCEGTVTYRAPDGATFEMYFLVPMMGANDARITGVSGPVQSYDCSVTFPKTPQQIDARYFLEKKRP